MKNITNLGRFLEIYDKSQYHELKSNSQVFKRKILAVTYIIAVISAILALFLQFIPYWLAAIILVILVILISICIDFIVQKEYEETYKKYYLFHQPFLKRRNFLSYIKFSEYTEKIDDISLDEIDNLLEWYRIHQKTSSMFKFSSSPLWLLIFSVIGSLIIEYMKIQELFTINIVALCIFIITAGAWFTKTFYSLAESYEKKLFEISKYIEFYKLNLQKANKGT